MLRASPSHTTRPTLSSFPLKSLLFSSLSSRSAPFEEQTSSEGPHRRLAMGT
jgi:hypothetical protein